ncbi:MAG TPA: hypothetical protein VGN16_00525 [Acidobacteriaceae bacterium]
MKVVLSGLRALTVLTMLAAIVCLSSPVRAQAPDGVMSEAEIESLRDSNYIPTDRLAAYEKILDSRQKRLDSLMVGRRHVGREIDLHDLIDDFGKITDELNDNLDDYRRKNRDVRKVLPKLVQEVDKWVAAIKAPPDDEAYNIVRKVALDSLRDLREEAEAMIPEQEAYFKAHPDAAKAEKDRRDPEHAHDPHQ